MTVVNNIKGSMGRVIETVFLRGGYVNLEQVKIASNILNDGGVVALPTDTIYGLAVKADKEEALRKLYQIKGRDQKKPLAVCLSKVEEVGSVADISNIKSDLLNSLLPGPLTLLLHRGPKLSAFLNPGINSIGVRIPDHSFITAVCQIVGPLALTSANRSGQPSAIVVDDFRDLIPELDCTFDCGPTQKAFLTGPEATHNEPGSTVIDLTKPKRYKIIREGRGLNRAINTLGRFGYRMRLEE